MDSKPSGIPDQTETLPNWWGLMEVDQVADMMMDMKVDKVADMVADMVMKILKTK